ncbi:Asp23/Gls24 family envelope stress response protein [Mycolicibacterium komossense]|uniref:Asp23/Gls24 family envelope stress response protein n=1 Tax=Mycolicibacterium komossense TaxID=1779 RepID=A0ABT3CFY2_9MYCO|nr:Asp23/Gls24 family envelope stress response protein [Mycolicibacterium komossense]MCV7228384.1 Asp23/Gls24 family envelope stress response protein [Mycolicibacterium komossense]
MSNTQSTTTIVGTDANWADAEISPYQGSSLVSSQGKTSITDTVVSKIAGIATREVSGVHGLGGGASRVVGTLREHIPGASVNHSQGVSVEVGEKQTAIDIAIVADYGVSIADVANGIRRNVVAAIERMTGLEATEVNIAVHDVHLSDEEDHDQPEAMSRLQ